MKGSGVVAEAEKKMRRAKKRKGKAAAVLYEKAVVTAALLNGPVRNGSCLLGTF